MPFALPFVPTIKIINVYVGCYRTLPLLPLESPRRGEKGPRESLSSTLLITFVDDGLFRDPTGVASRCRRHPIPSETIRAYPNFKKYLLTVSVRSCDISMRVVTAKNDWRGGK